MVESHIDMADQHQKIKVYLFGVEKSNLKAFKVSEKSQSFLMKRVSCFIFLLLNVGLDFFAESLGVDVMLIQN